MASEMWVVVAFAAGMMAGGVIGSVVMAALVYGHQGDDDVNG